MSTAGKKTLLKLHFSSVWPTLSKQTNTLHLFQSSSVHLCAVHLYTSSCSPIGQEKSSWSTSGNHTNQKQLFSTKIIWTLLLDSHIWHIKGILSKLFHLFHLHLTRSCNCWHEFWEFKVFFRPEEVKVSSIMWGTWTKHWEKWEENNINDVVLFL